MSFKIATKRQITGLRKKMDFMALEMLNRALRVKGSRIFVSENWKEVGTPNEIKVLIQYPVVCIREHVICGNNDRLYISSSQDDLQWKLN
jgi:hypothetical protein